MHEEAEKLIPALANWNRSSGIKLLPWMSTFARYDHAAAYLALAWPDFVVHDESVFLSRPGSKTYDDWMKQCKGDKAAVERVMNHQHILDLFLHSQMQPTFEIAIHLCEVLKDMWSCKLKRDFPNRQMVVETCGYDGDELLQIEITIYQERKKV
jgi:hypothetical protein